MNEDETHVSEQVLTYALSPEDARQVAVAIGPLRWRTVAVVGGGCFLALIVWAAAAVVVGVVAAPVFLMVLLGTSIACVVLSKGVLAASIAERRFRAYSPISK